MQGSGSYAPFEPKITSLRYSFEDYYSAKFQVIAIRDFPIIVLTYTPTHIDTSTYTHRDTVIALSAPTTYGGADNDSFHIEYWYFLNSVQCCERTKIDVCYQLRSSSLVRLYFAG